MAGKKNIMDAIKRAVSPSKPRATLTATPSSDAADTPLTRFVLDRLEGPSKELFAMSFAAQMSIDKHALVFDLSDALPWLGIDRIDNAIRLLTRHFKRDEYKVEKVFLPKEENSDKGGRPGNRHLISLDMFEDLLMLADTKQGKEARKMYKQLRDAVQDYMKVEMEASARAANERLAIEEARRVESDARRLELESAQAELQATLNAEKERRAAMKALRDAEDDPKQTAYLMESGVHRSYVKIGKTGEEGGEKRKKELQTGNPEEITVLFEMKCVDSKLVERNLHHIFRWYKRRGEWYEIDKERAIFAMQLSVNLLDGLRRVEHDTVDIVEACQELLRGNGFDTPVSIGSIMGHTTRAFADTLRQVARSEAAGESLGVSDDDPFAEFRDMYLQREPDGSRHLEWSELKKVFVAWYNADLRNTKQISLVRTPKEFKDYFKRNLPGHLKTTHNDIQIDGWFGWRLKAGINS